MLIDTVLIKIAGAYQQNQFPDNMTQSTICGRMWSSCWEISFTWSRNSKIIASWRFSGIVKLKTMLKQNSFVPSLINYDTFLKLLCICYPKIFFSLQNKSCIPYSTAYSVNLSSNFELILQRKKTLMPYFLIQRCLCERGRRTEIEI